MGRRKVQHLPERAAAAPPPPPPARPACSVSFVRGMPELRFLPEDSVRLGPDVWERVIPGEVGTLPASDTSVKSPLKNQQSVFEAEPPAWNGTGMEICATLQHLQAKMDCLQNTLEDMPLKVSEIMKQIWLTTGQEYLKRHVMPAEMVSPATGRHGGLHGFLPPPLQDNIVEPSLNLEQVFTDSLGQHQNHCPQPVTTERQSQRNYCLQPVSTDGHRQRNHCLQPVTTDGQSQRNHSLTPVTTNGSSQQNHSLQPVTTDGQSQQNHCISAVFGGFHCQHQSQAMRPTCIDRPSPEESLCTQPVFTARLDPHQKLKHEPLSPEENGQEKNQVLQQAFYYGPGPDPSCKLDLWCSNGLGPAEPAISLASNSLPAVEAAFIGSLTRRNANSERPLFKAIPGSVCETPTFIETIKEEISFEDLQCSEERVGVNKASELCVTDPHDLEVKPSVINLNTKVVIKGGEETTVRNSQGTGEQQLCRAIPFSENRKRVRKQGASVSMVTEMGPCVQHHVASEKWRITKTYQCVKEEPSIPQTVQTLQSNHKLSELANGRDHVVPEEDARMRDGESSGEGVHDSEERDGIKGQNPVASEHQEEATEEIKQEAPSTGDHDWIEVVVGTCESFTAGNEAITKTENLKTKHKPWTSRRKKRNSLEDGHGLSNKLVKKSAYSQKAQMSSTCAECGETFVDRASFLMHQSCHSIPHQSTYCKKTLFWHSRLVRHLKIQMKRKVIGCSLCGKFFTKRSSLVIHKRSHMGRKHYKCTECDKSFTQGLHLWKHQKSHTAKEPPKCADCGKHFTRMSDLRNHQMTHSSEKPHECKECGKHFTRNASLTRHQMIHSGEKPFTCPECGKNFNQRSHLRNHQWIHSGVKPYECVECGNHFTKTSDLKRHWKIHYGENYYACTKCGKYFTRISELWKHQRIHSSEKPHECKECGKHFTRMSELRNHQRIHSREKPYECMECGKHFTRMSSLRNHWRIHSGEMPYTCTECGKHFNQMSNLKIHQKTHSGEKPHECTECGKVFTRMSDLRNHQRIHSGEKPYQCMECDKHFTRMSSLRVHKRIHSGEMPWTCSECGKNFNQMSNLKIHQKTHSGDKPHECTECGKHFTTMSDLKRHQRTHSGEKHCKCPECGKCFTQTSYLRRHQRLHTGELH
ncbi:zinc finger protein 184-like [Ambystoma mexicanum]|uniref:zinc finger protein 184-like n=1 Tax=Ambystoma mexicanum TaxID=8296 RepID=UPI0037E9431A